MVDSAWAFGSPGPTVGAYEQATNWTPMVVPDGTAYFGGTFKPIVTISSTVTVGGWTIGGGYQFINSGTLSFTGAGIVGASIIINGGTVNFTNGANAGGMGLVNSGTINFLGDGPAHDHKVTAGNIAGAGLFNLGANQLTVGATSDADTEVSGQIVGAKSASLVKMGDGTLTLKGVNTYGGGTTVLGGELVVDGAIGKVLIGKELGIQFATLSGNGLLGATTIGFGRLSAGHDDDPGRIATGNLKLLRGAGLLVDISDVTTPGVGYDQVSVHGKVRIAGAFVSAGGFDYEKGSTYKLTIIDNDGKDKVDGIFGGGLYGGLHEGDAFVGGLQVYSITYKGGTGNDVVLRSEGVYTSGNNGDDLINTKVSPRYTATKKADYVEGQMGSDTIKSGGGNDTVLGGSGADKLDGGKGNDFVSFFGSESGDRVITLKGSKASVTTLNGVASDTIKNFENAGGSDQNDRITGDGKNNILRGESGDDIVKGGAGRDVLVGGYGRDKLTGGADADQFVFDQPQEKESVDKVTDFRHGVDKLLLEDNYFDAHGSKLDASEFYAKAGAKSAHDKNDHVIYDTKSGKLYYDFDGKGGDAAYLFATLTTKPHIDHTDFAMIV